MKFAGDVQSLVKVIQILGNPFEEESRDIIVLGSKEIADHSALCAECLSNWAKSIQDTYNRSLSRKNKVPLQSHQSQ